MQLSHVAEGGQSASVRHAHRVSVLLVVVVSLVVEPLVEDEELDEDVLVSLVVEPPAPPSPESITTWDPHAASPIKAVASATSEPCAFGRSDDLKSECEARCMGAPPE